MKAAAAVILAAGMGTRMRSRLAKVLHPVAGRPMLEHVIQAVQAAGISRTVVVVGHQADRVRAEIKADVEYVIQREQLGTGHAVMQAAEALSGYEGPLLVTYGDTPLYRAETYRQLIEEHTASEAAATLLSTLVDDPTGYGRVLRDSGGEFLAVVEERDIETQAVRAIKEINTGSYCFNAPLLFDMLSLVKNDNQQGEYYLPDVLGLFKQRGMRVGVVVLPDATEALGINDRRQLAVAEGVIRRRVNERWMEAGVTIVDPETTYIHPEVEIGRDTTIYPFTMIEGKTVIGEACRIGPHARIRDCVIQDGAVVETAVAIGSHIGQGAIVEPYTFLRPGSKVAPGERVQAFETRKD